MSSAAPIIFDRVLMRQRILRIARYAKADFLADFAAQDFSERLLTVKREFTSIADIGTPFGTVCQNLSNAFPQASIFHLASVPFHLRQKKLMQVAGDEECLPFAPECFDLVTSALSLQFVNDLPGALVQIRRSLKPDGLFLGCLTGGRSLNELRSCLGLAETEVYGGVSPRVAPCADVRDLGGLLQRAGFALPVADSETLTARYNHMFALIADLRAMGATNFLHERLKKPARRRLFLRASEIYAERFAGPDGRIRATFELIFLSGWAPHESQQKPLQPGSAKMRLADALKRSLDSTDE